MKEPTQEIFIHPTAEIHPTATIGNGTKIWRHVHIRENASIGANCNISKDVYIDAGVQVGNRVKIQNGVSVYQGVILEDDSFVGPHAAFTNDIMPRSFSAEWQVVPTVIKRGASIGANATVICGITLGPYSMISAGSTITTNAPPHGLMSGSPARLVAYICRRGHRMRAITPHDYETTYRCERCNETLSVGFVLNTAGSGCELL